VVSLRALAEPVEAVSKVLEFPGIMYLFYTGLRSIAAIGKIPAL